MALEKGALRRGGARTAAREPRAAWSAWHKRAASVFAPSTALFVYPPDTRRAANPALPFAEGFASLQQCAHSMPETTPLITGVDFVCVPARDFDAMSAFYGETLGLPFVKRFGDRPGIEYQAGNLTLAIMRTEDFGGTFSANAMPIALQVDDVASARNQLEAKGVRFVSDTFDSGVCWQAICLDPDGNPLSLHHRYAPKH